MIGVHQQYTGREKILFLFYPISMLLALGMMYDIPYLHGITVPFRLLMILPTIPIFVQFAKMSYRPMDKLVSVWILYNLLGVVSYLVNGISLSVFFVIFWSYIYPIFFYYYGRDPHNSTDMLYTIFLCSCLFCFVLGFYYYFTSDPAYLRYLVSVQDNTWHSSGNLVESNILQYSRFGSFLGSSYAISYLSIPALCISLSFLFKENIKKKWMCYLSAVVCILAAVLCLQRIALIYMIVVLVVYSIYGWHHGNKSIFLFFSILFVIAATSLVTLTKFSRFVDISLLFEQRFEGGVSVSGVFEDEGRLAQYQRAFGAWRNILTGNGPGTTSGFAGSLGFTTVCDGEFIRVIVEYGIIGSILFFSLIIGSIKKAFRNKPFYLCEIMVIFYFLAAGLISNSLSINHLFAPIFWFCIGRVWNESFENNTVQNV